MIKLKKTSILKKKKKLIKKSRKPSKPKQRSQIHNLLNPRYWLNQVLFTKKGMNPLGTQEECPALWKHTCVRVDFGKRDCQEDEHNFVYN
jgi:hypothetical protein